MVVPFWGYLRRSLHKVGKPKEELQCRLYGGGLMTKVQASIQKRPQGKKERVAYVCTVMSAPDMPAWLRLSALTRV